MKKLKILKQQGAFHVIAVYDEQKKELECYGTCNNIGKEIEMLKQHYKELEVEE